MFENYINIVNYPNNDFCPSDSAVSWNEAPIPAKEPEKIALGTFFIIPQLSPAAKTPGILVWKKGAPALMSFLGVCSNSRSFTKQPRGFVSGVCARNPSTREVPSSSLIETDALGSTFEIEATLRFSILNLLVSPIAVLTSLTRSSEPLV